MMGLLQGSLYGPQSHGAGRWLQGLLSAQPVSGPGISVPGNQFYPGYSFGAMAYPTLQRLGLLPMGGLPPGAAMQQGRAQGLLSGPAPQAPAAPAPAAPAMSDQQAQALKYLAGQAVRGLDPMNANYGLLAAISGREGGPGQGGR